MSKRRVVALARVVRAVMDHVARCEGNGSDNLQGYCGRAAAQLLWAAQSAGIPGVEAHMNEDHVFNVYTYRKRRYLIDITATQFGVKEKVFVRRLRGGRRKFHHTELVTESLQEIDFLLECEFKGDLRRMRNFQKRQKNGSGR